MSLSRTRFGALLGVLLAGTLCSAQAQQSAGGSDAATAETLGTIPVSTIPAPETEKLPTEKAVATEPARLQEVVVTATKRATPVRKIAGTVNVLSGEDLEREGVQSIDEIVSRVPGVNLTDDGTGGTAKRITIRGISTGFGVNPTTGTFFGDIPFSDPFSPKVSLDANPFDIATVEVLKGPQGTLFGGTGLNGLLRYVPEPPNLDEVQLKYYTQLQSYPGNGGSDWNYGGVVNAPFANNKAALRLVGFRRKSPGYVDNTRAGGKPDVNTLEQDGVRGSLTWLPAERWSVGLVGTMQKTYDNDLAYTDNYEGRLEHSNSPRPSPAVYSYALGTLSVQRELDWGQLISQTSYLEKKFNIFLEASRALGGFVPILAAADDNHSNGITQELRLLYSPRQSPWKALVGAFYYNLDLYDCASVGAGQGLPSVINLGPLTGLLPSSPLDPYLNGTVVTSPCAGNLSRIGDEIVIGELIGDIRLQEKAVFGELTRKLGQHFEATLGARVYRVQTEGTVTTAGALYATANQGRAESRDASVTEQGFSPKASIAFFPTRNFRTYATISRGFRFGGPQIAASTPTTDVPEFYKSDSIWNYELGVRTDWLDRTLRFDASAYYLDWKDPQVFQRSSDNLVSFIDNVGGAKGKGVESLLRYLPPVIPGLSLELSTAFNKTVSSEPFDSASGTMVPTGSDWPLSPRWQTATTLAYTLPVMAFQAGASIRHNYLSRACNTIECTARVFGYRTLDLNVFASGREKSYWPQISVSLNNLTDERGIGNVTSNMQPAGDTVTYIAPRSLVVRLSGNF